MPAKMAKKPNRKSLEQEAPDQADADTGDMAAPHASREERGVTLKVGSC